MNEKNLSMLSETEVVERLRELVREEREVAVELRLRVDEVKARGLQVPASCSWLDEEADAAE